eukprot:3199263-Amphidinium_carterae.1
MIACQSPQLGGHKKITATTVGGNPHGGPCLAEAAGTQVENRFPLPVLHCCEELSIQPSCAPCHKSLMICASNIYCLLKQPA